MDETFNNTQVVPRLLKEGKYSKINYMTSS